ncbi:MAG: DUF58 domain-containing protein [Planctomycetes bacterium]|nr:DUF58 domain-containing protein [Planctomycetota bacterium]
MSLQGDVHRQVLERLGNVFVSARQAVESVLSGQHRSVRRGLSVEFAGHRPYQAGDDIRRLDWLVYARSDRYDVRVHEEETRLRATLIVDASGSMGYAGSSGRSKLDHAKVLAAALGFLMVRQSDSVGLVTFDRAVRDHLPPATTMGNLLVMLDRLEALAPGGETGIGAVLSSLAPQLTRRGLVILITDAFDDPDRIAEALSLLRYRKQDVRVLQVVDPLEQSFPFPAVISFRGLEGEPTITLDADRIRGYYHESLAAHRRALAERCHAIGVQLETLRTDEDLALSLIRILMQGPAT